MGRRFVHRLKGLHRSYSYPRLELPTLSNYETDAVELGRHEVHLGLLIWLLGLSGGKHDSMAIQALGGLPLRFEYPARKIGSLSFKARLKVYNLSDYLLPICQSLLVSPISKHVDVKALNSLVMKGYGSKETGQLHIEEFPVSSLRHISRVSHAVLYLGSRQMLTTLDEIPLHALYPQ
jgi:hypothetical protein